MRTDAGWPREPSFAGERRNETMNDPTVWMQLLYIKQSSIAYYWILLLIALMVAAIAYAILLRHRR